MITFSPEENIINFYLIAIYSSDLCPWDVAECGTHSGTLRRYHFLGVPAHYTKRALLEE